MKLEDLKIKIFADGADPVKASKQAEVPYIAGFTTNPTLMRKAGIIHYATWAEIILEAVHGKPVSFEVLSDDFEEMERQARTIASWGANVYVKIPITNTKGVSSAQLIQRLSRDGIKVNVTAVMTGEQIHTANIALANGASSIVSVFAGRVADTGVDAQWHMSAAKAMMVSGAELLWASTREVYNILEAEKAGCDIITVPDDLLNKLPLLGKDLREFSLDTVQMFFNDAIAARYEL